jgi:hypothetical protein
VQLVFIFIVTKGIKMSRGIDELNAAVAATNMIVPNSDLQILNFDKIQGRIIKFGKLNEINWKGKEGKPDNTTQHIRIYIKVDSFFCAEEQSFNEEVAGKVITINPRVAWLPEVVALQRSLEESTGNKDALFHHKIVLWRKDRKLSTGDGRYGYLEVQDKGIDSNVDENEHERIIEPDYERIDRDDNEPKAQAKPVPVQNKPAPVTAAPAVVATQANADMYKSCPTVEDAFKLMKVKYAEEQDDEKKKGIAAGYRYKKDQLIAESIKGSSEPMALAQVLNGKYFAKEQNKQEDLLAFARSIVESRSRPAPGMSANGFMEEEDDVPF